LLALRGSAPEPVPLAICAPDLMLAGALGALKAGKFFVAVNPLHPARHVRRVLDELRAPLLLCDRGGEVAVGRGLRALSVEELVADGSREGRPELDFDDARLAYVLYTSGSTGRPRGVAQSRRDMLHNVARHRPLAVGQDDCVTLLSADGFVAAISNPYIALLNGAALAPYSFRDAGVEGMGDWLRDVSASVLYAFPSFLRQLAAVAHAPIHDGLRLAYLGGETVLPTDLAAARRLFGAATLSVGLNSSETGLTCLQLISPRTALPDPVPVGRPVLDVDVAVVDQAGRRLGPGESGEIEIRSDYVRPRDWQDGAVRAADSRALPFRTGDRGRTDGEGVVYHLGRTGGMVKVRGFRVEVAEVEAVIAGLPEVAEAAVFGIDDGSSTAELAACVVGREADIDPVVLRTAVARELPPAMIPSRIFVVDALPRTANGKLDRKRLVKLADVDGSVEQIAEDSLAGEPPRGPEDAIAEKPTRAPDRDPWHTMARRRVTELWCAELDLKAASGEDDFFALGGTSIAAVSLVSRIRSELGVPVPLAVVFETPTLDALVSAVAKRGGARLADPTGTPPQTPVRTPQKTEPPAGVRTEPPAVIRELIELQTHLRARPLADRRRQYERAESVLGGSLVQGEMTNAGGRPAEWVRPQRNLRQTVIAFFHGGGYSLGSTRSHRHLAVAIGRAAGAAVLSVDYRLAPEHAFPAAIDDTTAAVRWLFGRTDAPILLAGDSAGGGLVVATMIALRDLELPLPRAGICLSPWVDLTCTADAYERLAERDPLLTPGELRRMASAYLQGADPRHPLASPALADLSGLPPLLIQVGSDELLLDDARRLARVGRAAGVEVVLEEWPDMIHAWPWYFPVLDEGRRAIARAGAFAREHGPIEPVPNGRPRVVPATLAQEAHLLIAPATAGRGYLSWVYQLNGQLDVGALASAVDDVMRRHEILRARFERHEAGMQMVLTPFVPGTLDVIDLSDRTKQEGLRAAIADIEGLYDSLSPLVDPRFRASLHTIDPKTAVLAMFVAEALVDSDSGSLLSAALTRAYAARAGLAAPAELPMVSNSSYLDHVLGGDRDSAATERAHAHWARQAQDAQQIYGWPTRARGDAPGATCAFQLDPAQWDLVTSRARSLTTTPYVLVLACLQLALARVAGAQRFLVHSIISRREQATRGMIGNFQSLTRIDMRPDPDGDLRDNVSAAASAVAEAIEHSAIPPTLSAPGIPRTLPSGDLLPSIRFYMFANHEGPFFAGVRRRRFRLHGAPQAPLTVSCIYGPRGRQDFVLSTTSAPQALLERLAETVRTLLDSETNFKS
jgi:acetyl esterase/lipase/acyl-coenzyme A synthetase/AMP-(fatty) acid ligase/acyl carrier protein